MIFRKPVQTQIPGRRKSDVPSRPPTVYATRRSQLYGRGKSKSVPSVAAAGLTIK